MCLHSDLRLTYSNAVQIFIYLLLFSETSALPIAENLDSPIYVVHMIARALQFIPPSFPSHLLSVLQFLFPLFKCITTLFFCLFVYSGFSFNTLRTSSILFSYFITLDIVLPISCFNLMPYLLALAQEVCGCDLTQHEGLW